MLGDRRPPPPAPMREDEEAAWDADETERGRVLEALGKTPVEVDEIIRFTRLRPAIVRLILLELELAGRLEYHGGGRVSLIE
jgi:DNA processing protein